MLTIDWRAWWRLLAVEILFLSASILIVTNAVFLYWFSIQWFDLARVTGVAANTIFGDYLKMVAYIQNPFIHNLSLNGFSLSANGQTHFLDVRRLFLINDGAFLVSASIAWPALRHAKRTGQRFRLVVPLKQFLTLLVTGGLFIWLDFNDAFIWFHRLAFRNQDWIFDPHVDTIIKALPDQFFLLLFIVLILLILSLNLWLLRWAKRDL